MGGQQVSCPPPSMGICPLLEVHLPTVRSESCPSMKIISAALKRTKKAYLIEKLKRGQKNHRVGYFFGVSRKITLTFNERSKKYLMYWGQHFLKSFARNICPLPEILNTPWLYKKIKRNAYCVYCVLWVH